MKLQRISVNGISLLTESSYFFALYLLQGLAMDTAKVNEHLFRAIIDTLPVHLYWTDEKLRLKGCNKLQADNFGVSVEEAVGKTMFDFAEMFGWDIDFVNGVNNVHLEVMRLRKQFVNEYAAILPDGKEHHFLTYNCPLIYDGHVKGIVGISTEITELLLAQKALEKEKDRAEMANLIKTEFLENMRHDIRTPISGIIGFSELIKTKTKEPEISEYATDLVKASYALLNFLNGILKAIKITSGNMPLINKKFNLYKKLKSIVDLNMPKAKAKNLALILDYDEKIPQYLLGDPKRIYSIFLELVTNSLKFTNTGNVTIKAELARKTDRNIVVKIIVEDTGIGIPKEDQENIYIKFKKLNPSYQTSIRGIGIGLSVVKQFVEELNAELYLDSNEKGTRFSCFFSFQEPLSNDDLGIDEEEVEAPYDIDFSLPDYDTMTSHIETISSQPDVRNFSILVVEDNLIAGKIAESLLRDIGHQVVIAETGEKALEQVTKDKYDLIFMDIGLPGIDGYEVTRKIRNNSDNNINQATPIIGLSAHIDNDNRVKCTESGMDTVLSKPLTKNTAQNIIDTFVPFSRDTRDQLIQKNQNTDDETPININKGAKILGGNRGLAIKMIVLLQDELKTDLIELKSAKQSQNWEQITHLVHKIQGGIAYFGAARLYNCCNTVKQSINSVDSDPSRIEQVWADLISEIERVIYTKIE